MIDRNSPIPLYYQLKLHIKQLVETGELRPGDRLPTEMELCDSYSISRAPVRQALAELVREGMIYRRAGQGTFVSPMMLGGVEETTTVRVLAHYDVRWMATMEHALTRWNAQHPEHTVRLDLRMCSREEFHDVLRRAVIQGDAPDIVPLDYVWMAHYAHDGYITPLEALDATWAKAFEAELEPPVRYNNTFEGALYGVPVQADITGLWYRRDWFEQESLSPPQTWSEWLGLLDYVADAACRDRLGHQFSLVLPVTSMTGEATVNLLIAFIWMCGGDVVDDAGNVTLYSPQVCEALHFLRSITLERRAYLPTDVYRSRWWDLARFFAQGVVPMALGGSYEWPRIKDELEWSDEEDVARNLGFVLLPRPSLSVPQVGSLGGTTWVIFTQSSVQDLSLELLKFLASPEASTTFCEDNLQISPFTSVNAGFMSPEHPWLSSLVPMLSRARPRPKVAGYLRLSHFLQDMFERILWQGADVDSTVQQTARMLSFVLAE